MFLKFVINFWLLFNVSRAMNDDKYFENQVKSELPCSFHQSVNITGSTQYSNSSYYYDGNMYNKGSYGYIDYVYLHDGSNQTVNEHLRGCICGLKNLKPCLPFCCPPGHIQMNSSKDCLPYSDNNNTIYTKHNQAEAIEFNDKFRIIQTPDCELMLLDDDIWEISVRFNIKKKLFEIKFFLERWYLKFE